MQKCYSNCLHTNILIISNFAHFFFLSSPSAKPTPSSFASSSNTHTPTNNIKNQPQNQPQTPQNQTHPHSDIPMETERVDQRLWRIGVLGSECLDRRVWIGVLLSVLGSEFQISVVLGLECSCVNNFFNSFRSALVVVDWLNP